MSDHEALVQGIAATDAAKTAVEKALSYTTHVPKAAAELNEAMQALSHASETLQLLADLE
jgi:hypothetical protein